MNQMWNAISYVVMNVVYFLQNIFKFACRLVKTFQNEKLNKLFQNIWALIVTSFLQNISLKSEETRNVIFGRYFAQYSNFKTKPCHCSKPCCSLFLRHRSFRLDPRLVKRSFLSNQFLKSKWESTRTFLLVSESFHPSASLSYQKQFGKLVKVRIFCDSNKTPSSPIAPFLSHVAANVKFSRTFLLCASCFITFLLGFLYNPSACLLRTKISF